MTNNLKPWLAAGLAAALVLAAGCSGSNGDDNAGGNNPGGNQGPVDSASVPDSAGSSMAGFLAYLLALGPNDETSEPRLIKDNFAVPVDEGSDSQPLS